MSTLGLTVKTYTREKTVYVAEQVKDADLKADGELKLQWRLANEDGTVTKQAKETMLLPEALGKYKITLFFPRAGITPYIFSPCLSVAGAESCIGRQPEMDDDEDDEEAGAAFVEVAFYVCRFGGSREFSIYLSNETNKNICLSIVHMLTTIEPC